MGKLIILSGPSGVGKGPMVNTLSIYLKSIGKALTKHVLYTTREIRKATGEVHGESYWFSYLMNVPASSHYSHPYNRNLAEQDLITIQQKAKNNNEKFDIFPVQSDQNQGINYSVLLNELNSKDVVLLEIFQKKVNDVVQFCKENGIEVKIVFISPLSDEDYKALGCCTKKRRAIATEATMIVKLRSRGTESEDNLKKRAKKAIQEVEEARKRRKKDVYIVNHFGEDMKSAWNLLQQRVAKNPHHYDQKTFSLTEEIDKTFREFLEKVFL